MRGKCARPKVSPRVYENGDLRLRDGVERRHGVEEWRVGSPQVGPDV